MYAKYRPCTLLCAAIALVACGKPSPVESDLPDTPAAASKAVEPDFREILARPARPAADRARDEGRKPADLIEFLGIEEGDNVIDLVAAGGYYTEVLSLAVGPQGHVAAQNPEAVLEFRDGANDKALSKRLNDDRLPNVSRLDKNFQDIEAADGPYDAALTALNFHDIYNGSGPEAAVSVLKTVRSVLKPGGILGIIDHVGAAGADNRSLHRVQKSSAIEAAEAAGFVLEGDSNLLAHADDDHTRGVFSEGLRGRTDRFALKFRKPANPPDNR